MGYICTNCSETHLAGDGEGCEAVKGTKATEDAAEQAYRRIWTRENKKDADALWIEINRGRNLCAKAAEQMTKDGAEIERLRAENTSLKVEIENLKDDLNIHPRFREDV